MNDISTGLAIAGSCSLIYAFLSVAFWRVAASNQTAENKAILRGMAIMGFILGGCFTLAAFITKSASP
jgi:hypothetical protein